MPFSSSDPLGYTGINQAQQPPFINADRAPTASDFYQAGSQWQDNSVDPPVIYETTGGGEWNVGSGATTTSVNDADSPYTVLDTDYLIAVDTTSAAVTITLPAATESSGKTFVIRDVGGDAATNNITISGGGTNLVGGGSSAATKTISANYAGATVISDGTVWTYAYVA